LEGAEIGLSRQSPAGEKERQGRPRVRRATLPPCVNVSLSTIPPKRGMVVGILLPWGRPMSQYELCTPTPAAPTPPISPKEGRHQKTKALPFSLKYEPSPGNRRASGLTVGW
jgi:hypothetical protein